MPRQSRLVLAGRAGYRRQNLIIDEEVHRFKIEYDRPLLDDCRDAASGELVPLQLVTDNGPAFTSIDFVRFIARHPELRHVPTRHHAPETNDVVERFNGSLKYEHLYREEIADVLELHDAIEAYRALYNHVRPYEALGFSTPMSHYPAEPRPGPHLSEAEGVPVS